MPVSRMRTDELSRTLLERVDMTELKTRRPKALAEMARAFAKPLHRFVSRLVGRDADAEDVVQQTYASVIAKIDTFEGSADNLRCWVFTIAYRAAMDVLRHRGRDFPLEVDVPAQLSEPIDPDTSRSELARAFRTLTPSEQSLLTLKYQDDLSNLEIAEVLSATPNHVGVLVYRAKQSLRKAIS